MAGGVWRIFRLAAREAAPREAFATELEDEEEPAIADLLLSIRPTILQCMWMEALPAKRARRVNHIPEIRRRQRTENR